MTRVAGTDLFYYSTELEPDARANYHYIRDYVAEFIDPRNPRSTTTAMYGPNMEPNFTDDEMPVSWVAMPRWRAPAHLAEPAGAQRGHVVRHELESDVLQTALVVHVYLPAGYDENGERRYPVAYYHDVNGPLARGSLSTSLDNLLGAEVRPVIVVFIEPPSPPNPRYTDMWANELVPFIDSTFRTVATRDGRAGLGNGWGWLQRALCGAEQAGPCREGRDTVPGGAGVRRAGEAARTAHRHGC